jgi:prephenate dehydrogenase
VRLVVLGFGLIGGGVASAARARGAASHVIGIDRQDVVARPEANAAANELIGVNVDAALLDDARVKSALSSADLVVVATPVSTVAATIGDVLAVAASATDCGSTKRAIAAAAARSPHAGRFVPGHPMAGLPQGGIERANADLFEGRPWILCPDGCDADAVDRVQSLVLALGATPVLLSAAEHDRAVALTSHVPQILASALAVLADNRRAGAAAGPAFESATRVAGGGEAMWKDILSTNADEVCAVLGALRDELDRVSRGLDRPSPDLTAALDLLERARSLKNRACD